jgi:hypothetical protein
LAFATNIILAMATLWLVAINVVAIERAATGGKMISTGGTARSAAP